MFAPLADSMHRSSQSQRFSGLSLPQNLHIKRDRCSQHSRLDTVSKFSPQRCTSDFPQFLETIKLDGRQENVGSGGAASPVPGSAAPVLQRSANRWVPPSQSGKDVNDDEAVFRKLRGILNKLTVDKYDRLVDQILAAGLHNNVILQGVVILLFDKAVDEPHFSSMYAELCQKLAKLAPNFDPPDSKSGPTFRRLLVKRCQEEFKNRTSIFDEYDRKAREGHLSPEDEERRLIAKSKMLGNIKFIGEIGKLNLISERILHECIQELLGKVKVQNADVDDVECLCKLLTTVGKLLDHEKAANHMNKYFERMQDMIDLRAHKWIPRREISKPKAIKDIREEMGMDPNKALGMGNRQGRVSFGSPQMMGSPRMQYGGGPFQGGPRGPPFGGPGGMYQGPPGSGPGGSRFAPPSQYGNYGGGPLVSGQAIHGGQGFGRSMSGSSAGGRDGGQGPRGILRPNQRLSFDGETSRQAQAQQKQQPDELERLRMLQQEKRAAALRNGESGPSLRPQNTMLPHGVLPPSATPSLPPSALPSTVGEAGVSAKFTAPPKPKTVKKIRSKEDLETVVKKMLADYLTSHDVEEAIKTVKEWELPGLSVDLVCVIATNTLDAKNDANRIDVAKLLVSLVKEEAVTQSDYLKGLKMLAEQLDDLRLDVPLVEHYVAQYILQAYKAHMLDLNGAFKMAAAHQAPNLFFELLVELVKAEGEGDTDKGREAVRVLMKEMKVDLLDLLPKVKRTDQALFALLKDKNLEFLAPLLQFESQLAAQLKENPTAKAALQWILAQPAAADIKDPQLVMAISRQIVNHCTANTTFNETLGDKERTAQEMAKFKEFCPLLRHFTDGRPAQQLATIYALQVFCHEKDFPKGLMQRCFMYFYKFDVCEDEAFLTWKEDVNEKLPGKGRALFQVNQWLNWLQEEDEEDDE